MRRGHYIKLCTTIGNGSAHARARCLASGAMDTNKHASPCLGPEEKQAKKARLEEACEDDLYCEHVFASSQTQCLKAEYDGAVPYKHVVIDGLFRGAALRKVREQLIHAVKVDFKETDIFKVFQSGTAVPNTTTDCTPHLGDKGCLCMICLPHSAPLAIRIFTCCISYACT